MLLWSLFREPKGDAMRNLMRHGNACSDNRSLQGIDVCSLSWKYTRRTTTNVLQTLHYLAHCPPALSRYLHAQCFEHNRISFEWERCKCFGRLSGSLNSRDEWLSFDLYTLKRFLIFGAMYVFCAKSDAWSERRVAIALLLFTRDIVCWQAVDLEIASKHFWKTRLFECLAVIRWLIHHAQLCAELIPCSAVTLRLIQYFVEKV